MLGAVSRIILAHQVHVHQPPKFHADLGAGGNEIDSVPHHWLSIRQYPTAETARVNAIKHSVVTDDLAVSLKEFLVQCSLHDVEFIGFLAGVKK
jgi:hypothetical protein